MTLSSAVRSAMLDKPEQTQPNVWRAAFFFSENFAGFDGHFPNDPILPGIAQIIAAALTVHPEGPARIRQIKRSKFISIVKPGETMTVRAYLSETAEGAIVTAECSTGNGINAQIKLLLVFS